MCSLAMDVASAMMTALLSRFLKLKTMAMVEGSPDEICVHDQGEPLS